MVIHNNRLRYLMVALCAIAAPLMGMEEKKAAETQPAVSAKTQPEPSVESSSKTRFSLWPWLSPRAWYYYFKSFWSSKQTEQIEQSTSTPQQGSIPQTQTSPLSPAPEESKTASLGFFARLKAWFGWSK